jgi:molybdate transport system ATP-binding protein
MVAERGLSVRLRVARGGFTVDVAFEAPPGVTLLFGPSGAGKSTVLAGIAGLVRPDAGRVTLDGEALFDDAAGRSVPVHARRIGYVFQSLALFPHMSVRDNVAYGIDRALPRAERQRIAEEALARFSAAHVADRRTGSLSGGEAQRVALARAIATRPRALLLDEPFSALDGALRNTLALELRRVAEALAVPFVHVTHHPREARAVGDRAVLVRGGRVVAVGPVDDVLAAAAEP